MSINKNGIITAANHSLENIYKGIKGCTRAPSDYILPQENVETDVFKDYGFTTALKLSAVSTSSSPFLAYQYLVDHTAIHDKTKTYVLSMYAYVPSTCNANFRLHLEHNNTWISNHTGYVQNIGDTRKDQVIWVWGKFKVNQDDGKMYVMLYPNPNQANVFTQGYMLVTGISIYESDDILLPEGQGFVERPLQASMSSGYIAAKEFYEV